MTIGPPPVPQVQRRKPKVWLHLLLFVLTIATTTEVVGPIYSACLLSILTAHEFGHYFAAKCHKVEASLPFFIPVPSLLGTMGAVIRMSPYMPDRRALFDIAAAGPLGGMVLAVPISFVGLSLPEGSFPIRHLEGFVLGFPVLFQIFHHLISGPHASHMEWVFNEIAFAGWVGLFVTALNLLPIGQLDGGHIAYAALGRKSRWVAGLAFVSILGITLTMGQNYALFLLLLLVFGVTHRPTMNDSILLDAKRKKVAWLLVVAFILCFTPVPLQIGFDEPSDQPLTEKATNSSPEAVLPLPPPAAMTTY